MSEAEFRELSPELLQVPVDAQIWPIPHTHTLKLGHQSGQLRDRGQGGEVIAGLVHFQGFVEEIALKGP